MTKTKEYAEDTCPLDCQCRLPLSTRTVNHLADLLRRHLKAIRSRWRILPPGKIAVIVLAVLRHDQRLADMAGGNDVSESTVRPWRDELIGLLAARAPRLDRALKKVAKQGGEVVLIDGALIRTQRRTGKADRRNHSGKHRSHGLHFLALTDEKGRLIWISAARPGRPHDNTAARHDYILAHLRTAGLGALADLGFRGLDNDMLDPVIVTGYAASRTHKLTLGEKEANRVLAVGRAPVEHGFAHLKNWRTFTEPRTDPARVTRLLRAPLVLTNLEVNPRPVIAERGQPHGSGPGTFRCVVERATSWLHGFRRLRIRWEGRDGIHGAFLAHGCALICWRRLSSSRQESLLRHDRGQRFAGRVPCRGKGGNAGAGGDDPARDGTGGVDVAAPGDRDPQALVQVVEVPRRTPQGVRDGVGPRHPVAGAQDLRGVPNRGVLRHPGRDPHSRPDVAVGESFGDCLKEVRSGRGGPAPAAGRQRRGQGDRHRPGDRLRMVVRDRALAGGLLSDHIEVGAVPGTERGGSHGRAVAPGSLAAELSGDHLLPGLARIDPAQHVMHRGSIAAVRVLGVGRREAKGQAVLVDDAAALDELPDENERLSGVVAPPPQRFRGQRPRLQGCRTMPAQDAEPAIAEGVAEGEPVQRIQHSSRHIDHRRSIAARRLSRTPVSEPSGF
ncbi:hypothetical protein FHS37_003293 [Streptomyces griseostramineus]|uniref:DDE Tnp4 domain-containing protein n=1 Tax=Streptomyces griseomycini TaxID=66895 RepID=A0A7W7M0S4_9ACTN|nr:hypothetical protein [Streptomyces griseomycini]